MYTAFASVYDYLMRDVDYEKWAAHYARLMAARGVKGGDVCECACGTGALTLPLARRGYRVIGVDASESMLSVAQQKARNAGLQTPFIRQDMCALTLHRRQNAVLSTCDGVNYLLTPVRLRAFFNAAYAALKPGGALIFDVSTPEKLQNALGNNVLSLADERVSYIWNNVYSARARAVDMRLVLFVRQADGRYERMEETQRQRAHTMEELRAALQSAGFGDIRFYGEYTLRAPKAGDQRWHVSALRPKEKA